MPKPKQAKPVGQSSKICLLVHSHPGVGKTRLLGTAGKGTLMIRPPTEHMDAIKTPGVEEWEVHDWNDMWEVQDYFRAEGGSEYKWAVLDNISLFQDHGLDNIWEDLLVNKPHRKAHGLDKGEYGVNMHRLGQWVRHMVGMPGFNFAIVAHTFKWEDGDERFWPYIQGKNMAPKICGYMNVVAYLEIKQGKRVLRLEETEDYFAKDQFDAFGKGRLVDPTMPKIMAAIDASRPGGKTNTARRTPAKRGARRRRTSK